MGGVFLGVSRNYKRSVPNTDLKFSPRRIHQAVVSFRDLSQTEGGKSDLCDDALRCRSFLFMADVTDYTFCSYRLQYLWYLKMYHIHIYIYSISGVMYLHASCTVYILYHIVFISYYYIDNRHGLICNYMGKKLTRSTPQRLNTKP